MVEQDSKTKIFYPANSIYPLKKVSYIEFSDKAIIVGYSDTSLNIPYENIKEISIEYIKNICCIKYKVEGRSKMLTCCYKWSDLKQIKKIFNDKKIHIPGLPEVHTDSLKYSNEDKNGPVFSCGARKGYLYGLRIFIIITLIIRGISGLIRNDPSYKGDHDDIMFGICIFGIFILGILCFLFLIIKDTHLGLTILDDGIIMRMYDFNHEHIKRIKIMYKCIENITISQISKNRYNVKIKCKGTDEFEIKNLKKGKKLEEELKQKGIYKVNFVPKNEDVVKIDPPYI